MLPKSGRARERTVWIWVAKADADKQTDRFWWCDVCLWAVPSRAGPLPGAGLPWTRKATGRAGSRRRCLGCGGWRWRRAGLVAALEDLDDDHGTAAARAGRSGLCIVGRFFDRRRCDVE